VRQRCVCLLLELERSMRGVVASAEAVALYRIVTQPAFGC
jgi:hypothetical protein